MSTVTAPYYADDKVALYHGDCRGILPELGLAADLIVADPPYGETSLDWDVWPDGWPSLMTGHGSSLWCFGSMRMFLAQHHQFADWRLSQDVVWEKHNGSGFAADRFKRVHEHALHWYRGRWSDLQRDVPRIPFDGPTNARSSKRRPGNSPAHLGAIAQNAAYVSTDRMMRSVIRHPSMHGNALNETEKPTGILEPLITYGCPPGGLVLDPFAGSCSTLVAARALGRRAVGIEKRESQCEKAALRLAQDCLDLGRCVP